MKNPKKMFGMILMSAVLLLGACSNSKTETDVATAEGESTYNFKMSYVTQTGHNWHKFAEKFKEELDAKSDGRMKLELFPAAQLGPEADMVQQMQSGSLDFAVLTVPYLSTRVPAFDAWNLPFLFDDLEGAVAASETAPAKEMLGLLEEQGIKGLGYLHAGTHNMLLKVEPIKAMKDVDGKKLRFTGGASVLDFWKGLGSSPIAMGLPEVYNALQTGVIDGLSIDKNAILSEKYYEIAENYVLTKHMVFGGVVASSLVNYDNMPENDRKIIDEAFASAVKWGTEQLLINDVEDEKKLEDLINIYELENRGEFIEEAKKVHEEYANTNELIKEFISTVKKQ